MRIKERRHYFKKKILQFLWFLSFPNLEPFTESSEMFVIYKYISPNQKGKAFTFFCVCHESFSFYRLYMGVTLYGGRRAPKRPQPNGFVR